MPPRPRQLSELDHAAWAEYARHVRSLPGRAHPAPKPPPATPARSAPPTPAAQAPTSAHAPRPVLPAVVTGLPPPGLDRASWTRFSDGKRQPARTLDLHGKTAQAAFVALESFLLAAHADRLRVVEIITGRGTGEQGGVIRRELPHWLNLPRLRPLVLAAAHPHARNDGSTRVLLRRVR